MNNTLHQASTLNLKLCLTVIALCCKGKHLFLPLIVLFKIPVFKTPCAASSVLWTVLLLIHWKLDSLMIFLQNFESIQCPHHDSYMNKTCPMITSLILSYYETIGLNGLDVKRKIFGTYFKWYNKIVLLNFPWYKLKN